MTPKLKNKIKAFFLLIVFSLNTVAGFACSVGIDLGYNISHPDESKQHAHGHQHTKAKKNHIDEPTGSSKMKSPKDDCCSSDVTKFALLDKSVAQNNFHLRAPVFLLAFATTFLSPIINEGGLAANCKFQFVRRSSFLNDTDIQMAIRRFQI